MGACCTTPVQHTVQLPDQLETGDLILFRTKSLSAAVTRWCTDAPFDHVAMVLRTSEGYRTVECTGQGIGCWVLQERIDDHIIKGVVIRRLRTALTNDMVDRLNKFLQSVKHKPYRLNQTILQRMIRTCLCCQRIGQNERGLEEWTEDANQRSREEKKKQEGKSCKNSAKYTTTSGREERKECEAGDQDEEDGQVPIPQLLPPLHRDAAAFPDEPVSPSVGAPASATSAASSSSSSLTSAASSASATADPKIAIELKDHESIREHYPLPEDIAALHLRRGFFCSSFIAACYMKMGLLPAYPPIDWYLPNTFSSRTAIQAPLINAEFGEETLVAKPTQDKRKTKWTNPYLLDQEKQKQQAQQAQSQPTQSLSNPGGASAGSSRSPTPSPSAETPIGAPSVSPPTARVGTAVLDCEFDNIRPHSQRFMKQAATQPSSRSASSRGRNADENVDLLAPVGNSLLSGTTSFSAPAALARSIVIQVDRSANITPVPFASEDAATLSVNLAAGSLIAPSSLSSPSPLPNIPISPMLPSAECSPTEDQPLTFGSSVAIDPPSGHLAPHAQPILTPSSSSMPALDRPWSQLDRAPSSSTSKQRLPPLVRTPSQNAAAAVLPLESTTAAVS